MFKILVFSYSDEILYDPAEDSIKELIKFTSQVEMETHKSITIFIQNLHDGIRSMNDTLIVLDIEGRIKNVNWSASYLLDYTENELIGQSII